MFPFASYVSRGQSKPRLIFSRINGPIVADSGWQVTVGHRTLADQNLPVSDEIQHEFGHYV